MTTKDQADMDPKTDANAEIATREHPLKLGLEIAKHCAMILGATIDIPRPETRELRQP